MRRKKNERTFKGLFYCFLLMSILVCMGCGKKEEVSTEAGTSQTTKSVQEEVLKENETEDEAVTEQAAAGAQAEEDASAEDLSTEASAENSAEDAAMSTAEDVSEQSADDKPQSTVEGVVIPKEENDPAEEPGAQAAPRPEFPITLEDGNLTIESVFQYSGINLDCEDEMCENIGAIQVKNTSDEYLENADIIVNLSDGSAMNFHVDDVPAGDSIIAFEVKNSVYDVTKSVGEITANAKWSRAASLQEEKLSFAENGMTITVKNISGKTLQDLTVKYHCDLDGIYFGGKSYEGHIKELGAGESITLDASECYLGEATVVNVID